MPPDQDMSKPNIYIIDDDQTVRESLEWLMTSVNLPVQTLPIRFTPTPTRARMGANRI